MASLTQTPTIPTLSFLTVPDKSPKKVGGAAPRPIVRPVKNEAPSPSRSSISTAASSSRPPSVTSGGASVVSGTSGNTEIVFGLGKASPVVEDGEPEVDRAPSPVPPSPASSPAPSPAPTEADMISYEEGERLFLPLPTRYVFIFVNPRSGPQQGRTLLSNVEIQHYRMKSYPQVQVQLYDITNDADRKAGEAYLQWIWNESPVFKEQHQELHIWSAGGDGTFKGVLDICLSLGIDLTSPLLYFSVIPFGTGNDLSQVVGWGRTVPHHDVAGERLEKLNEMVTDRLNGIAARIDVWEIEIEVEQGGFVRKAKKARKGDKEHGPHQTELKTKMSNYFSLGIQGIIGSYFEAHRTSSRIGNIMMYARSAAHFLFRGFPHVIESLKAIEVAGRKAIAIGKKEQEQARTQPGNLGGSSTGSVPLLRQNAVELLIANIPGLWGRQVDLWSVAKEGPGVVEYASGPTDYRNWGPNTANDGKLEIFMIRNVGEYFLKQLPWHRGKLSRVGQFPSDTTILFHPNVETYCNIDGEFFQLSKPKSITFRRTCTVKMVCPSDLTKSRLARDELAIPGAVNRKVLPVDETLL